MKYYRPSLYVMYSFIIGWHSLRFCISELKIQIPNSVHRTHCWELINNQHTLDSTHSGLKWNNVYLLNGALYASSAPIYLYNTRENPLWHMKIASLFHAWLLAIIRWYNLRILEYDNSPICTWCLCACAVWKVLWHNWLVLGIYCWVWCRYNYAIRTALHCI